MPLIVLSPYSGNQVKVRDQDIGRAIRDEEGRIFYVVPRSDGKGHYAAMTRNGSAKDEERYRELEAKTARQTEVARETVTVVHDATGKPRGRVRKLVLAVILAIILGLLAYAALIWFGDDLRQQGLPVPEIEAPSLPQPATPQLPPAPVPEPAARVQGAAFQMSEVTRRAIEGTVGAALAEAGVEEAGGVAVLEEPPPPEPPESTEVAAEPAAPLLELPSGVRYRIESPGQGASAKAGDYVLIHYATLLPDGSVIDSTRGEDGAGDPIAFVLWGGQVIRGWDIGIAGMQVGERRHLLVPAALVTGSQPTASRPASPEGAVSDAERSTAEEGIDLHFEIELVDIMPGVLQQVTREGSIGGRIARPGDMVEVEYRAYLDTATEPFDDTALRGQPLRFRFGSGQVIQGLDLGIAGMKEGERRTLVIPPYLAYGQRGITGLIPPHATLRYELELKRVVP